MIAQYNGKCALTGTKIIAGQTEIARVNRQTVLAEYGTQEAVDAWFAARVAEAYAIIDDMAQRGEINADHAKATFDREWRVWEPNANKAFVNFPSSADFILGKIAQLRRMAADNF